MSSRQENKNFDTDGITLKDSNTNVNIKPHRSKAHFLIDASKKFPSSFFDKTSMGKSTINGDDDTITLSEDLDLGNSIIKYSLSPDTNPRVDSRSFTTDTTNLALKNSANFLRKNTSPTIYKTLTPRRADATTSNIPDLTEDGTGRAAVSGSRLSNFPSA